MSKERLNWHKAFYGALQMELSDYRDILEFRDEYQLTLEPLRIDVLVIKKKRDVVIKKNIGAIFRQDNIVEFKSPDDNFAVKDFYKTMAYCYLYAAMNAAPITELSLTIVETRHPDKVLDHLKTVCQWAITEESSGIYTVCAPGILFPIQFIESKQLSAEENLWLTSLRRGLKAPRVNELLQASNKYAGASYTGVFLDIILKANVKALEEVLSMSDLTLEEVFEKHGFIARWEARGELRGEARGEARAENKLIDLLKSSKSKEEIMQILTAKQQNQ